MCWYQLWIRTFTSSSSNRFCPLFSVWVIPKPVLILGEVRLGSTHLAPGRKRSYWAALWRLMRAALLLGAIWVLPSYWAPFGAILTPPNQRAWFEAPFGACAVALAQKCAKFTSRPRNIHSLEFWADLLWGNTYSKEPSRL